MAQLNGVPATPDDLQALALTGYGHFTSMRVDKGAIRGFSQHLERLVRDCRLVFDAELDRERIRRYVRDAVAGQTGSFVVRVTVFDPDLDLGRLHPAEPGILVATRPVGAMPAKPIRVVAATYVRDEPLIKHVGLFGQLRHRRAAQLAGWDDVVFVDDARFISEGATWNVGFFDGARVIWPDAEVLPGVTMQLLKQVHDQTISARVNLSDLPGIEAVFATNTSIGVRAITAVNDMTFPAEHHIFATLRKEYEEIPPEQI
jgi:branched-subunit amino acid aminotransferase/4-amino-4-deoxychorismate lyase